MVRLVVKLQQLRRANSGFCGVIAEFNFIDTAPEDLDNRSNLSPGKPLFGQIFKQSDYRKHLEFRHT